MNMIKNAAAMRPSAKAAARSKLGVNRIDIIGVDETVTYFPERLPGPVTVRVPL